MRLDLLLRGPLSHQLRQLKDRLARTQLCVRPAHSAAVPRRLTSLSLGSVTRMVSDTSRPTGRSSSTTRPSTCTARLQRCHGPRRSVPAPPNRRTSRRRMASAGLTPPQRLLSVTDDPAAALRSAVLLDDLELGTPRRWTVLRRRAYSQLAPVHRDCSPNQSNGTVAWRLSSDVVWVGVRAARGPSTTRLGGVLIEPTVLCASRQVIRAVRRARQGHIGTLRRARSWSIA
jgi:hypothetical protein